MKSNTLVDLRGSVPDDPNGRGPLVTQTSIPCVLWMLRSIVGVNGLPLRLQCWKLGGRSSTFAPAGLTERKQLLS